MAIIAAGTAIILSILVRSLAKHRKLAYWLAIAFLAAIVLAALFDEVGLADLLFIIITGVPIILLLRGRSWYLHPYPEPKQERAA
jgi:predicted membrane channel-forming protein YqfA (hemolysin III family)